jgi:26S proteasome regulatory subunit N7
MGDEGDITGKDYYPKFELAQNRFSLLGGSEVAGTTSAKLKADILALVKEKAMLPYYENLLCPAVLGPVDEALKAQMKKQNDEELEKFEEKINDAKENLGDTEVRDALLVKAEFFNRIGDKDKAIEAFKVAFEKTIGVGAKLDNILTVIRIGFYFDDKELTKKEIERAKLELTKGGDWERRNKLKVYEGIYLMTDRKWKEAATLFLNVMPTFTATELVEFKDFVFYTVILTMVALDRPTIREKLVSSPEVRSAIKATPHLEEFMEAYYYCRYHDMMQNFIPIIDKVKADRYLSRHCRHFMRIMRLNAYRQFLASYKSVTLEAMGNEFGVSTDFMDSELASFIASGKLTCKIDKVGGVIESTDADQRSQVYAEIIKQGDLLLNRMQKLSGTLDM